MKLPIFFFAILLFSSCKKEKLCPSAGLSSCDCETETTPQKMELKKFTILKFPEKNKNGESWDIISNTDPDLTIKLFKDSTAIWESETVHFEAKTGKNYVFEVPAFAVSVEPTARYRLMVYDFEIDLPGGQEWMGGIEFTPYQPGLKFPDTLDYDCSGCNVSFRLETNYLF